MKIKTIAITFFIGLIFFDNETIQLLQLHTSGIKAGLRNLLSKVSNLDILAITIINDKYNKAKPAAIFS